MTTKHTPGPWGHDTRRVYTMDTCQLCSIATMADSKAAAANARLIAAAPELLEALAALLWQHDNNGGILCGMALQDARAAIARATGKDN